MVGNLLIIISIFCFLVLCLMVNFLFFGLVIVDFGVGVVLELLYIIVLFKCYMVLFVSCILVVFFIFVLLFLVVIFMFVVMVISLDRYLVIYFYLRYKEFFMEKKVIYL